ncbi:MAG: cardiolipin synthase [Acidobacteriota bacterium]
MIAALIVLTYLVGFVSSIHAVMNTRTSQGAIAWAVSLNTLPYAAVPAYWVFGRSKFEGYVVARQNADLRNPETEQVFLSTTAPYRPPPRERASAARAAEALAGLPILSGNQVDLLIDGEATFESIFEGIDQAEDYLLIQFYIVRDDGLGRALKERLMARAEAGVRVFFLYDEVGSYELPESYRRELRAAGIQIFAFNSRKGRRNRFQLNFRNHRKIVVADGRVAWIGGHNVGDEYLGKSARFGHWRDTHVRIEGPSALGAQVSFVEDWYWSAGVLPELQWAAVPAASGSSTHALVLPSGPADSIETANLMFVSAINISENRIWIASPYFVPDQAVLVALQLASLRGVDVRILIPDRPDHTLVYLAAFSFFDVATRSGIRFYRYTDGFLHEKALLIDDDVAAVGTANFDNRSFRLNFEITTIVADPGFASEVETMFVEDFQNSRQMVEGEFERKPWWFRVGARFARLTAPIL